MFKKAISKWKDVYRPSDAIELSDNNISYVVQALQQYHLVKSGDVLGVAFELLVNQEMKGDMGQYFTPRQVVSMMVEMLDPQLGESVCDPAVGSGGFLIYSMRHVFAEIDAKWDDADDRAEQRDVLIGCTAHEPHYVGNRVDLIDDATFPNFVVPVADIMIIRARESKTQTNPAFLASFLRTRWGKRQFQRLNRGVRGGHVYGDDVESYLYYPEPPYEWMQVFITQQDAIRAARRSSISNMAKAVELIEQHLATPTVGAAESL